MSSRTNARLIIGLSTFVVMATLWAHWPALDVRALSFDDHQYLVQNPLVTRPSVQSVRRFLTEVLKPSTVGGYYQPLAMISLMVDYACGGRPDDLRQFHRTSLALHAANTVLMIVLLWKLFGGAWAAAMAGLLFGLHPLTVESIPWVGERKTLLATFFALASLFAYVGHAQKTRNTGEFTSFWSQWRYILCFAFFGLALMSKPTTTTLPAAMLLMDIWPLRRFGRRAVLEKLPLFGLAGVSAVITYISQAATFVQTPADVGPMRIPLVLCHNIVFYLCKIIYPSNLSSHYPFPEPLSLANPSIIGGVVGTVVLLAVLIAILRKTPAPLIGWLIFFALIFPTMGVIGFTIVIASDKYAYLPAVGLLMVLAAGLARMEGHCRATPVRRWRLGGLAIAACLVLAACEARTTRNYLAVWRTTESLYEHMLSLAPRAATLHFGMGFQHESRGRILEAEQSYRRAIDLDSRSLHARNNLGLMLIDQGKYDEAMVQFRAVLQLTPGAADAHSNAALALAQQGRADEAIAECRKALNLDANFAPAHNNWGLALSRQNDIEGAIDHFREAIRVDPLFVDARRNLAAACWRIGRLEDAARAYADLIAMSPRDSAARINHGQLFLVQKKWSAAAEAFGSALQIDPNNIEAARGLRQATTALHNEIGATSRPFDSVP